MMSRCTKSYGQHLHPLLLPLSAADQKHQQPLLAEGVCQGNHVQVGDCCKSVVLQDIRGMEAYLICGVRS